MGYQACPSGKPDDITHEWSGETILGTRIQNSKINITITEIDHDDQMGSSLEALIWATGWYNNTYSFESGKACIGRKRSHPSTNYMSILQKVSVIFLKCILFLIRGL